MTFIRNLCFIFLVSYLLVSSPLLANQLPAPEGQVLLVVSGNIQHTNQGKEAHFDRDLLEALTQRTTQTATPWSERLDTFSGPLGKALIEAVGAMDSEWMTITALNDYSTQVPVSDFYDYEVILALKKNDRYLRVRDRGPLFVIYPFDEHPHLNTEMHYNRSVWQVKKIEFHE
ncbi:hypothetical protein SAMN05660443_1871 [Marinospirillum celere]|uniref:Oxidoreductase molybdopterin-binding domain-containing protein n=1 Tax=Marinospirillum celere TaxID=1122252 RepID=A0A1I1H9D7_9GAMM|nr:hypothetical protein [Marinospirillum celere]SFC20325.1 hypothetical protein SAMN05660443_1871 [Marinospirillum celere]